jgi:hypothetical protein
MQGFLLIGRSRHSQESKVSFDCRNPDYLFGETQCLFHRVGILGTENLLEESQRKRFARTQI